MSNLVDLYAFQHYSKRVLLVKQNSHNLLPYKKRQDDMKFINKTYLRH